jgi:hypothetical protein
MTIRKELADAIINLLIADSTLKSLLSDPVQFYQGQAPNRAVLPYLVINMRVGQWDTMPVEDSQGYGSETNIDILIFTNERAFKDISDIGSRIKDLLRDTQNISMVNHNLTLIRFIFENVFSVPENAESDQNLSYGVLQFRALTEEI